MIAFSDEEGVRFQSTFLGSAALAGVLPVSALQIQDKRLSSLTVINLLLSLTLFVFIQLMGLPFSAV